MEPQNFVRGFNFWFLANILFSASFLTPTDWLGLELLLFLSALIEILTKMTRIWCVVLFGGNTPAVWLIIRRNSINHRTGLSRVQLSHTQTRKNLQRKTNLPDLVITISVPCLWNSDQSSLCSRFTLGSSLTFCSSAGGGLPRPEPKNPGNLGNRPG